MIEARLPPLKALRAFEAAARLLSVKAAAQELSVTPGAVSQMIKLLEQHLGVALFLRINRGIVLTDAGQRYLPPVRQAFRQIMDASARIAVSAESGVLTVSATAFFASAWLVPRLEWFRKACPDIDLQILTGNGLADFTKDGVDVAIRHGMGRYAGLHSDHLLTIEMVPVAAPELVRRLGMPAAAADLLKWPRLHDEQRKGWQLWFAAQGIEDAATPRGLAMDEASVLARAIAAGQGAGLLPEAMVRDDLKAGRLVRLAQVAWLKDFGYYLVYPPRNAAVPKVVAFRHWLLREAGKKRRAMPNLKP